jgi:TonB-dependent starch-binding outer membrane protein SusC
MFTKSDYLSKAFCFVMLLLVSSSILAQNRVTGKITNQADNQPVIGATVTVKGTTTATQTGTDGSFVITAPSPNSTLVITYVGFDTREIRLGNQTSLSIGLTSSTANLNEVVVTGYTAQKKKEITGAVSVIRPGDLTKVSSQTVLKQLEGRASGVTTNSSGAPGGAVAVRIRGTSTLTEGGGDPLLIVDGVQMRGAFLNQLNPNDVESIQVLKDAATTAAYGIGANAGVIIITTKKGKTGAPRVDASTYYGAQTASKTYEDQMLKTSAEYADLVFQSYNNAGQWPQATNSNTARTYGVGPAPVLPQYVNPLPALAGGTINTTYNYPNNLVMKASPGTNWWDAVFQKNAPMSEHNVSVSGGGTGGRYFFSANYFTQDGIMKYTDYNRYMVRGNTEFKVKGFTLGENLSVAFDNGVGQPNGNQVEQNTITEGLLKMQPIIPIYDEGGNWGGTKAGFGNGKNGLAKLYRNKDNRGEAMNLIGNVFGEVNFLDHFTGRVMYGVTHGWNFGKGYNFTDPESNEPSGSGFNENINRYFNWIFQQQLNYNNKFGDHDVKLTGVHEAKLSKFRNMNAGLSGYQIELQSLWYINTAFGDPATRSVNSNGGTNNAKESWLGRLEYGYKGKYLLSGSARYDQSSNFADKKGQLFGGGGIAWRVSDENFMQGVRWVNDLKLRAGYGVTGNDAINPGSNYSFFGGGPGSTFYDINGTNTSAVTGYTVTSAGHPVVWEKQKQKNIGIDATFFRNRLETSIDIYDRSNKDFLLQVVLPATFGAFGGGAISYPYENLGKMSNKGIEMSFNWKDNFARDWRYEVGLNLTHNKNKIDELAPQLGITDLFPPIPESRIGPLVRDYTGSAVGTFYGLTVDGIYQNANEVASGAIQDGKAIGRFRFKDINNDKKIDNNDKAIIGDPNPDWVFGLNLGLNYKNFDFTVFLQGTQGNDIFNYVKYFTDFYGFNGNRSNRMLYQSWTPTRTNAILPKLDITDNYSFQPSTYYIEDGSYIRAKVIQLGYRLPSSLLSRVKIDNARVYVQGQNLFTITNYQGLDPTLGTRNNATEGWTGIDYGNYPTARVLMVGLQLSF